MNKEAAWLLAELAGLVEKGVLDEGSAQRLRAHYASAAGGSRLSWGMVLLATGGAALVGLGVILIFAHNWENWVPGVRVALSLAPLLLGQAACFLALRSGSRAWAEGAGLFTAIAAGAAIALIAQTYQFGGDLPRFLLTWTLLAVPLAYLLGASSVACAAWLLALAWIIAVRESQWWVQAGTVPEGLRHVAFLGLFALPLPYLAGEIRRDRGSARVAWMLRVALAVFVIGLAVATAYEEGEALVLVYAALAALGALSGERYFAGAQGLWGNPLAGAGRFGVYLLALFLSGEMGEALEWPQSPLLLLALVAGLAAAALAWRCARGGRVLLPALLALFAPLVYAVPVLGGAAGLVLANAYALVLAGATIRAGLRDGRLALATEGAALLAALVLVRFFDSDMSYVVRGVGFITCGAGFFAGMLWLRRQIRGGGGAP
jgi:hypothetical protein